LSSSLPIPGERPITCIKKTVIVSKTSQNHHGLPGIRRWHPPPQQEQRVCLCAPRALRAHLDVRSMGLLAVVRLGGNEAHLLRFGSVAVTVLQLKQSLEERIGVPASHQRIVLGCGELADGLLVQADHGLAGPLELECLHRSVGGKGGFGAMLRSARGGLDSKKTTNFDAMRDLSGRRMRHVNNEAKLKEWMEGAPERAREAKLAKQAEQELARARARPSVAENKFASNIESVRETVEAGVAVGILAAKKKRQRERAEEAATSAQAPAGSRPDEAAAAAATTAPSSASVDAPPEPQSKRPKVAEAATRPPAPAPAPAPAPKPAAVAAGPLEWAHCKDAAALLASCGADAIKAELARMGLKCGGTPEQRAERLWLTKGKQLHELDPRLFAKKRKR
jgi:hypothetical protein